MDIEIITKEITIGPNRLETINIKFDFSITDFNIKFTDGYDNDILFTFSETTNNKISKENNIDKINSIGSPDSIKLYIKNTSNVDKIIGFIIKYKNVLPTKEFSDFKFTNNIGLHKFGILAEKIERDLNSFINANDGITCVLYNRIKPMSQDNRFKEYAEKEFVEQKELNLITEDNELPKIDEIVISEWGAEFNTFDAQIDYYYFQSIFGNGEKPFDGDYIYIKQTNSMYVVESSILQRGINGKPTFWNLTFGNYVDDKSVLNKNDGLHENIDIDDDIFREEFNNEEEDHINLRQNMSPQIYRDMSREEVIEGVVFNSDGYTMFGGDGESVKYINKITNKEFGIVFHTRIYSDTRLIKIGNGYIEIIDNKMVIFGRNTNIIIPNDKKIYVAINISDHLNSIQILEKVENVFKQITYDDNIIRPKTIELGSVSLMFGDHDIGMIRIFKKVVPKEITARLMSKTMVEKPSLAYIIDDAQDINNNPRAIESNFKPD